MIWGVAQAKEGKLLQLGHLFEARVGDFGEGQAKHFKLLQLSHLHEARVGDLGAVQIKRGEILQLGHVLEARVGDFFFVFQVKVNDFFQICLGEFAFEFTAPVGGTDDPAGVGAETNLLLNKGVCNVGRSIRVNLGRPTPHQNHRR